jgi:molecular chaperone DnaJ
MHIPEGTQPGDVLRLRGKVPPRFRGYGRGDLVVIVNVRIPTSLSSEQEGLLREFARLDMEKREGRANPWRFFSRKKPENSFQGNSMN